MENQPLDVPPLDVPGVFRDAFHAIGANFGAFLTLALLTTLPGSVMGFGLQVFFSDRLAAMSDPARMGDPSQILGIMGGMLAVYFVMIVVLMALGAIGQGAAIYTTVEHLVGRKASAGDALRVGLSKFFWLFLCSLLVGAIITFGGIFCILPGLVAFIWLSVAMPAVAVEGLGPIAAIQRSIELTEGHRLTLSLIYAVLFGALFGFSCCVAGPMGAIAGASATPGELPDPFAPAQIVMQIINFFVSLGFFMAFSSITSVAYARLRGLHDGVDADALAKVFA